jgi:mycothiol synthase
MPNVRSRSYAGDPDTPKMQALLRDCEPEASYDFHVNDLPADLELNTRLWEDNHRSLVAMAAFHRPSWLLFILHPGVEDRDLTAEIIDWATERVLVHRPMNQGPTKLWSHARADDGRRVASLERHGFEREEGFSLRMERPLDQPIPEPQFPPGYSMRPFDGERDAAAWADMWNDTGPGRSMSAEECLSWRESPDTIPELDLIALAPDGTFAAYCMGSISEFENAHTGWMDGWTDPIGTRPGFRRQGLARALVLTALHGLKSHGCERALLGVDGANAGAIKLYESCGYRTLYRKVTYGKKVD